MIYEMIYNILEIIGVIYIIIMFVGNKKVNPEKRNKKDNKVCFLIPARNEEKVLGGLLSSLNDQTIKINSKDIYVIVQDNNDKGIDIANKYNTSIFKRTNKNRQRKGYALDECIKYILGKKIKYDLYFILDADNILDNNFVEELLVSYNEGYDIICGNRENKNPNDNVISACSGWIFNLINLLNSLKSKNNENIILSGTGFCIDGKIIEELKGYPFHEMTEDYELTVASSINGYNSKYNKRAIFYDEQPTSFNKTIIQRTRWVKGYFSVRKKYKNKLRKKYNKTKDFSLYKEIVGINGIIIFLLGFILNIFYRLSLIDIIYMLIVLYILLVLFTAIVLILADSRNIDKKIKIKTLFFNPIFLLSYIWCLIKSFGDVKWERIEHNK